MKDSPPRLSLRRSLHAAIRGLLEAAQTERNFQIHILATLAVGVLGFWLQVSRLEWCLLLLCIGGVMAIELLNTALEAAVDLISPQEHELARMAKDVAAGAVLLMSMTAAGVGGLVFIPRLWQML